MKKFRACKIQHFADGRKKNLQLDATASPGGSPAGCALFPPAPIPAAVLQPSRYCTGGVGGAGGRRNAGGEGRDFNLSNSNDPSISARHRISALQTVSRFLPWIWGEIFPCRFSSGCTARRGTHASRCIPCSPHGPMAAAAAARRPHAATLQQTLRRAAAAPRPLICSRLQPQRLAREGTGSLQLTARTGWLLNAGRQPLSAAPLPAATRPALLQRHPDARCCQVPQPHRGPCSTLLQHEHLPRRGSAPPRAGLDGRSPNAAGCPCEGAVRAAAALLLQTEPRTHSTSHRTPMLLHCTSRPPQRSEQEAKR